MENTDNVKNALKTAKNIVMSIKSNPDTDTLGAALAVFFALKNIGKTPLIHPLSEPSPSNDLNDILNKEGQEKLLLSYRGDISEIFYEKLRDEANIYLTPKHSPIKDDSYVCRLIQNGERIGEHDLEPFDLLLTLGIDNYDEIESAFAKDPESLFHCDILNIDNNPANPNYGDINIIESYPCLSQTIACLIRDLGKNFLDKKVCDALLLGLFSSPRNADDKKTIPTMKWLIQNGGDLSLFLAQSGEKMSSKNKLLEKVLTKLDTGKQSETLIGLIANRDFAESGATSKELGFVAERLKGFFRVPNFLLLWENNGQSAIRGLVYSEDKNVIRNLKSEFRGEFKENGGILLIPANDLEEAKTKITLFLP